ncbi:exo-beta-N-acetylmuramidase NamZ family protein [Flavilitoribacter nigricans]|uniref:DUF1343 domain-containing protein n=1 Tax=Flavilitoribacter nigricans (strain ATCC 23147 / DSM 23189 / NBRC 102662 / NCIMB 1420 / SS-2) TaxID=1122177 RepID=A0A2D0MZ63_FLAN2|nr:DUF1343 domain-containing protein [Flavilitoribacter nigricans]PHN01418.1 hypothetical protein CRP01_37160 [Flavilitoribacter nigricans DSM 23189 = NBRC 102662]
MIKVKIFVVFLLFFQLNCTTATSPEDTVEAGPEDTPATVADPEVGAAQLEAYLPALAGKTVGVVVNHTSVVGDRHLVDILLENDIAVRSIFAPEHGFRGTADAGQHLEDGKDPETGLPVVSLYGKNRKPQTSQLEGLDWVIFDIQDVGARFYTYISTMHHVMDVCAEMGIQFMVLDRPNPNGHYVDGPILDPEFKSFVGLDPIPVVHGMTVGEYAGMVNGEGWLTDGRTCKLTVIPCKNYTHQTAYELPISPSPNLPNMRSIYLYPSTCFFEGTIASEGRGTDKQFQVYGHPDYPADIAEYTFTPTPGPGASNPKLKGEECHGYDLTVIDTETVREQGQLNLSYLIDFYRNFPDKDKFFKKYFDTLAGGKDLREQIIAGKTEAEIRAGWQEGLEKYRQIRQKYLLYPL